MAKPKKKANKGVKIDFTGVEGKRSILPDDDYLVEVEAAEIKEGQKADYVELTMVVQAGPHKGQKIWDRASFSPNALWRLRSLLEVMGLDVPDGEMELDPDDLVGCSFVAVTSQEAYKSDDGKKVAVRMVDFYTPDEEEEEPEEEEKPKGKKSTAGKKASKDEEEESDEEEEEETPEERKKRLRKERRDKRKSQDEDEEEKPKGKKASKKSKDEDEDEDEEPPKKRGKKAKKKADLVSSDTVMEADEDELQEMIDEHELEVDLDDFKTLRKKQAAVIDALEEAELLEE